MNDEIEPQSAITMTQFVIAILCLVLGIILTVGLFFPESNDFEVSESNETLQDLIERTEQNPDESATFEDLIDSIADQAFFGDPIPCIEDHVTGRFIPYQPPIQLEDGTLIEPSNGAVLQDLMCRYPCENIIIEEIFMTPESE